MIVIGIAKLIMITLMLMNMIMTLTIMTIMITPVTTVMVMYHIVSYPAMLTDTYYSYTYHTIVGGFLFCSAN